MRHFIVTLTTIILAINLYAGDSLRVLFIGNSYVYTNNIPDIVKNIANADGNSLNYSVSVPGGQTLQQHFTNPTTLNFIQQGNWDYVVLQEQSQVPSFPDPQVAVQFYPYAKKLDSLIHVFSPCAKTVFYVTWGRKNGDAQNCQYFPPLCTYEGMDDMLTLRYSNIADTTNAYLSPVGPLWRALRVNHPTIELYSSDESHPSPAGAYAAACSFYAIMFKKNIQNVNYNFSLSPTDASIIRQMAQQVVADSLNYWTRFNPMTISDFEVDNGISSNLTVQFTNLSQNAPTGLWRFGDGSSESHSNSTNPNHTYSQEGSYTVCLDAYSTTLCDTVVTCKTITVESLGIQTKWIENEINISPNPASDFVVINHAYVGTAYTLYDVLGTRLQTGTIKYENEKIDVRNLQAGVYYIVLDDSSNKTSLRFMKK